MTIQNHASEKWTSPPVVAPAAQDGGTPRDMPLSISDTTKPRKPLRFKIGVALLILYPFMYLAIPLAPMLPLDGALQIAFAGGAIAVAEVILIAAIALMGKEAYQAIKKKIKGRVSRKGKS